MKKTAAAFALLLSVTACFKGTYFETSYTHVATFEYQDASDIFKTDSSYFDSYFYSDCLCFCNAKDGDDFAGGFALSVARDSTINLEADQFSMYANYAALFSPTCVVFRHNPEPDMMPEYAILFTEPQYGTCTVSSCMVNNTALVVSSILSEDSPCRFESGKDWLKLIASGYLGGQKTGDAEFYLADFRSKDSVVTAWTAFDMSKLGSVDCIDFSFESSREDIPEYFCMDNLTVSINIKR